MNDKIKMILLILVIYPISFLVIWGIVEGWVLFWDYGWTWNEMTVPPLVTWDIFFKHIQFIAITALICTPIIVIIIYLMIR